MLEPALQEDVLRVVAPALGGARRGLFWLPLGTAYAVWTGIGAVGVAILGMVFFAETVSAGRLISLGLLIARVVLGLGMAAHGAQKLLGWFGGYGLTGTGGYFESLGFRPGRTFAAANSLSEVTGGLLLALGLLIWACAGPSLPLRPPRLVSSARHRQGGPE